MTQQLGLDDLYSVMQSSDCTALMANVVACSEKLGFDKSLCGLQVHRPLLPALTYVSSVYPDSWQAHYAQQHYVLIDPTVQHCQVHSSTLVWQESLYTPATRALWEESRVFGIEHGISVPVHDRDSKSMLSLARDKALTDPRELEMMLKGANLLANCVHMTTSRLVKPALVKDAQPALSARELECLRWASKGKTAAEIGIIVGIVEATAVLHLNNAVKKLQVSNRVQAVAVGVASGLIY
jgi:DNA-binding CsgD family transcriptional regulator